MLKVVEPLNVARHKNEKFKRSTVLNTNTSILNLQRECEKIERKNKMRRNGARIKKTRKY